MSNSVAVKQPTDLGRIEQVLMKGDLSGLNEPERVTYYNRVCETLGLNPLTRPFDYIILNGKLVLYANKGCAEQLRAVQNISIKITHRETIDGVYVVTAAAQKPDGRIDESTGAVMTAGLKGESLANAMMKAETKAKRRVTLSICGLNMLDETEVETIPGATRPAFRSPVLDNPGLTDQGRPGQINYGYHNRFLPSEVARDALEIERDRLGAIHANPRAFEAFTVIDEYLKATEGLEPEVVDESENPHGAFVIPFGKKKGMTVRGVGETEARSYLDWLERDSKSKGSALSANAQTFKDAVIGFYGEVKNG